MALDSAGNLYIADSGNNVIREVNATSGVITTIAGGGTAGLGDNGSATSAELSFPWGIAFDNSGDLYIADSSNRRIRKIAASGGVITGNSVITTVAGGGTDVLIPSDGDGGPATSAVLWGPSGISFDSVGNLYIADGGNSVIRKVSATTGVITTVAGIMNANGDFSIGYSGDGGLATSAELFSPTGIAIDGANNLYIADTDNCVVRKVTASTGIITTAVGNGPGCGGDGGDGGPAYGADLAIPASVSLDGAGNLYLGDEEGRVREVTASSLPPSAQTAAPVFSVAAGTYASPQSVSITDATPGAEIYIALDGNTPTGASQGYNGPIDVTGTVTIQAIAIAPGNLQSAVSSATYTITSPPAAVIATVAEDGAEGFFGSGGPATSAALDEPCGVTLDGSGNLYIADGSDNVVWMVSAQTGIITIVAGNGTAGYTGDGTPATGAELNAPDGVVVDGAGDIYITDSNNYVIRKVAAGKGEITTFAGNGQRGYSGDGKPATSAQLSNPQAVALDGAGNLYIADGNNHVIREVNASTGIITTVAGNNQSTGYSGDGGPATSAGLTFPNSLTIDSSGNLFVGEVYDGRVRKITASTGIITTVAGNGASGYDGDGGPATSAEIDPGGLALDSAGNLYIANFTTVREVLAKTGEITTIAGSLYWGYPGGGDGDGGSATVAELGGAVGISFDAAGNLYIVEHTYRRVREVSAPSQPAAPVFTPVAGSYTSTQTVTITDTTPNATIYYTTDGTTPTTSSTACTSCSITVSSTETIEAIAMSSSYITSPVATAAYTIANPVPVIGGISPAFANAGGAAFTLTVNGTGFVANSAVNWGTTALTTTYVSATQLTAQVPASGIASSGASAITVQTPTPGGGTSNSFQFEVDSASASATPPTFSSTTATVTAGSPASYSVTLPSSVESASVACLNLPAGTSCSYSATTNTVTITTTAATPAGTYQITIVFTETVSGAASGWILLPILLLPLAVLRKRLAMRGVWVTACFGLVLLGATAVACVGCGGGGSTPTPVPPQTPQTHQVTTSAVVTLIVH